MAEHLEQLIVVTEEQVLKVLSWPLVTAAVEQAMKATTQTQCEAADAGAAFAVQPARTITRASAESELLLTMPCFVGNYQLGGNRARERTATDEAAAGDDTRLQNTLACKLVTSFPRNQERKPALPNIMAHILLFSETTGRLRCVMGGTHITAWRTAAASIVATKYLYFQRAWDQEELRRRDGVTVAIIGCGVQGRAHAFGMCHSFPVRTLHLWNRTTSKASALAAELRTELHASSASVEVVVADGPAAAVSEADIICVCTSSAEALVSCDMLKQPGVHINAIGAGQVHFGEVAQDVYAKALVYIDYWAGARAELKDLPGQIVAEVGQVILKQSYPPAKSITVFQSLGMASEDATVAQAVYEALKSKASTSHSKS